MSQTYVAKDLERLEEVYYRHHGVNDDRYLQFCEKNLELLRKDLLESGDTVNLLDPKTKDAVTTETRVALWQ